MVKWALREAFYLPPHSNPPVTRSLPVTPQSEVQLSASEKRVPAVPSLCSRQFVELASGALTEMRSRARPGAVTPGGQGRGLEEGSGLSRGAPGELAGVPPNVQKAAPCYLTDVGPAPPPPCALACRRPRRRWASARERHWVCGLPAAAAAHGAMQIQDWLAPRRSLGFSRVNSAALVACSSPLALVAWEAGSACVWRVRGRGERPCAPELQLEKWLDGPALPCGLGGARRSAAGPG